MGGKQGHDGMVRACYSVEERDTLRIKETHFAFHAVDSRCYTAQRAWLSAVTVLAH